MKHKHIEKPNHSFECSNPRCRNHRFKTINKGTQHQCRNCGAIYTNNEFNKALSEAFRDERLAKQEESRKTAQAIYNEQAALLQAGHHSRKTNKASIPVRTSIASRFANMLKQRSFFGMGRTTPRKKV